MNHPIDINDRHAQFLRDNGPDNRATVALHTLNTAVYSAVREAVDANSPNADPLKHMAAEIDRMVDAL